MNSPYIGAVEQIDASPPWMAPASPMYQGKNPNWGQTATGYRESRHNNTRSKGQWSGARRQQRHQQPKSAEYGRGRLQQPPPPMAPPTAQWQQPNSGPTASSVGFQENQGPAVVQLHGLPVALCSQNFLEAMLEQAGLCENIMGCVVGQEQDTGKALVYFANRNSAQMCVDHFGGCCWDKGGMRVSAHMVDEQGEQPSKANQSRNSGSNRIVHKNRSKIQNEPYVMVMNQPAPMLPISPVSKHPWEFGQTAPDRQATGGSDEGSTVTGGSSGRASWDASYSEESPFACDTDDGF